MNKLTTFVLVTTLSIFSASAMACPKGTSLSGGIGMHHQGGKCVSNGLLKKQAQEAKKAAAHSTKTKMTHTAVKKKVVKKAVHPVKTTMVKPTTSTNDSMPAAKTSPVPVNPKL